MATYNTNNPLGSVDPRDLLDNSQIADHYISDVGNESWNDRFGNKRKTWKGIENEAESQLTAQENSFQQFLLNSGYEQLADYTDGPLTFTSRNQITAYNSEFYRPKASVSLPYTTTGNTATTWATDKDNFVAVGDAALRQELASEFVSLTWFGAVSGTDCTEAFKNAYATGKSVYVPDGEYTTDIFYPKQTFGPGDVIATYANDGLFNDPGKRVINPFNMYPQEQVMIYTSSRGNYERGAGSSIMFNMPDSRPQVMGFNNDATLATYANGDAVAKYIGARGPVNQQILSNCTFTATTLTSTDLTADVASHIKVGMFCRDTTNNYRGHVIAVDVATQTITVNSWYKIGNTASGQIPTAGVSVLFNDVTKLWGQNTVIFIEKDKSKTTTATGYELGFQIDDSATLIWGFDSVNYSASVQGTRAHLARGLWATGYYAQGKVSTGFMHELDTNNTANIPFFAQNLTQSAYVGSVLRYNTNYRVDTANLAEIYGGGVSYWRITAKGTRSAMREAYSVISAATTLNTLSATTLFWVGPALGEVTVNAESMPVNSVIELSNIGSAGVTIVTSAGNSSKTIAPGQAIKVLFDGTYLNVLSFSNTRDLALTTFASAALALTASSGKRYRFVGTADSTVTFNTSGMVEGQEFEIMNHSASSTLTVVGNASYTIQASGYGRYIYAGSAIYEVI